MNLVPPIDTKVIKASFVELGEPKGSKSDETIQYNRIILKDPSGQTLLLNNVSINENFVKLLTKKAELSISTWFFLSTKSLTDGAPMLILMSFGDPEKAMYALDVENHPNGIKTLYSTAKKLKNLSTISQLLCIFFIVIGVPLILFMGLGFILIAAGIILIFPLRKLKKVANFMKNLGDAMISCNKSIPNKVFVN